MQSDHLPNPMKLLGQISRAFARRVDAPLRKIGFAVGQLPVLVALKKQGALSQAELARIAQVEQPSMAQLLARMERDGLVAREPAPDDKRSYLLSLQPAAIRAMPKGKAIMDDTCRVALQGFSEREIKQLTDLLLRIDANLAADPAAEE